LGSHVLWQKKSAPVGALRSLDEYENLLAWFSGDFLKQSYNHFFRGVFFVVKPPDRGLKCHILVFSAKKNRFHTRITFLSFLTSKSLD
jgi:hypothetical protein